MKQVWLQAQQICTSTFPQKEEARCAAQKPIWWPGELRLHKSCHLWDIFKYRLSVQHTAAKKRERERKEREKVHYREKDFNVFNTHYSPRLASVRPPSTPICHSQRAYDAAIWKTEIISGVGGGWVGGGGAGDKAGWGWRVRTKGSKRWSEVQWFRKEVQCSAWIHQEYYYSTLIWPFWSCGPDMAVIYRAL